MTGNDLGAVLRAAQAVLFDFDGPICSLFAGKPASGVAAALQSLLPTNGGAWPSNLDAGDPLDVLRRAAQLGPDVAVRVERALRDAEVDAATVAEPTAGGHDSLRACVASGRLCAVVTNNSPEAATAYLARYSLLPVAASVQGRAPADPERMKPSPDVVLRALADLGIDAGDAVVIGDSVTDVDAAHAVGAGCIGYANRPHKLRSLAHADALVVDMARVAEHLVSAIPSSRPR